MPISYHKRTAKWMELSKAIHGEDAFIQVTEWVNGEGCDIETDTRLGVQKFSLDYDLMDALIHIYTARTPVESND